MSVKYLVTGSGGLLGRTFMDRLGAEACGYDRSRLDIADREAVASVLTLEKPAVVLNCAAYTDVAGAENDVDAAFAANARGPANLAALCAKMGILLVHLSTDYIFDGSSLGPVMEDTEPHPLNIYGKTKWQGEQAVMESLGQWLIVRVSWLFGAGGKNYFSRVPGWLKNQSEHYADNEQKGRVTYAPDAVTAVLKMVEAGACGIFHIANTGPLTRYEFALYINELMSAGVTVHGSGAERFGDTVPRPLWSVMATVKYRSLFGNVLPDWRDAASRFVESL